MIHNQINNYSDIKSKILEAVEKFCQPIIKTLTPQGQNVICELPDGGYFVTNDGVTIAKNISFKDPIENAVAEFIRHSSLKTNMEVGDGTTTSVLLARAFIKEGFKLIDGGWNPMMLTRVLNKESQVILNEIDKMKYEIKTDEDLEFIAKVASNNDEEIAKNTAKAVKASGKEGVILLESSPKDETEVQIDEGFMLESGMFSPQFSNIPGKFASQYNDVKVLITDKRIYYPEEAIAILKTLLDKGIKDIVIVAKDFIGEAPNTFITNHIRKNMNILCVKCDNDETLVDLASYFGVSLVSEQQGKLTTTLTLEDFATAKKVLSDHKKTLLLNDNKEMAKEKVEAIRQSIKEVKGEKEKEKLEKRLARMTSGTITIYVGGKTAPEVREKLFRYEDAVNATKSALRDGYVVGGGITLYRARLNSWVFLHPEIRTLFERVCKSPLEQIAINCNLHFPTLLQNILSGEQIIMDMKVVKDNIGYNAVSNKYEDLLKVGIIEPVEVAKSSFRNALSAANIILSSGFIINIEREYEHKDIKSRQ